MDLWWCLLSGVQAGSWRLDRTQGGGVKKKKPQQRGGKITPQEGLRHLGAQKIEAQKYANKGVKSQLKSKWIMAEQSTAPELSKNFYTPREHCRSLGVRGQMTKDQINDLRDFNLCFKCRGTAEPDAGKHRPENCKGQDLNGVGESERGINADNGSAIKSSEVTDDNLFDTSISNLTTDKPYL